MEERLEKNIVRWQKDRDRYLRLYGVDIDDMTNYQIILNTTELSIDEVITEVTRLIQSLQ
jgi:cytidylate kinase